MSIPEIEKRLAALEPGTRGGEALRPMSEMIVLYPRDHPDPDKFTQGTPEYIAEDARLIAEHEASKKRTIERLAAIGRVPMWLHMNPKRKDP